MALDIIDSRIAELKQRIAEKKAYNRLYRPNRNIATWDYVAEGDRSGYDKISSEEAAYHNMLRQQEQQDKMLQAQQDFAAEQNRLNRENAEKIAGLNKAEQEIYKNNEIANRYQLALTDYELAQQQVDLNKPETLARLKRAAQMVNHYGSQLNFDPVSLEATEDAEPVKINKAISGVKALKRIKSSKWTDEQKQKYVDLMDIIPDEDERKAELVVDLVNMPMTTNERLRIEEETKANWRDGDPVPTGWERIKEPDKPAYIQKKSK